MKQPYIILITGIATSGKSTLFRGLKKHSDLHVRFLDMDSVKLPVENREEWRQGRLKRMYATAAKSYQAGQSTIICGIGFPGEVIGLSPNVNHAEILLTISMEEYERRMKKRLKGMKRSMREKRVREWYRDFLETTGEMSKRFEEEASDLDQLLIIDTESKNEDQVLQQAKSFINKLLV